MDMLVVSLVFSCFAIPGAISFLIERRHKEWYSETEKIISQFTLI